MNRSADSVCCVSWLPISHHIGHHRLFFAKEETQSRYFSVIRKASATRLTSPVTFISIPSTLFLRGLSDAVTQNALSDAFVTLWQHWFGKMNVFFSSFVFLKQSGWWSLQNICKSQISVEKFLPRRGEMFPAWTWQQQIQKLWAQWVSIELCFLIHCLS